MPDQDTPIDRGTRARRADVSTEMIFAAIEEHGLSAFGFLTKTYPPKVVLAALRRDIDRGWLEYGVSEVHCWITPDGLARLAELRPPAAAPAPEQPESFTWNGAPPGPMCSSCGRERTLEDWYDYNPIQAVTGRPLGWYNGDDNQTCGQCLTAMMAGAWPAGTRGKTP